MRLDLGVVGQRVRELMLDLLQRHFISSKPKDVHCPGLLVPEMAA